MKTDRDEATRGRGLCIALAVYALVCAAALTWPGLSLLGAGRAEPRVLGLPLCFAWNVGWVVCTFFVLAAFHWLRGRRG